MFEAGEYAAEIAADIARGKKSWGFSSQTHA
jgi:hypothetical protein